MLTFFGLASNNYRGQLLEEIFEILYYGKLGLTYDDLWCKIPTPRRRYLWKRLKDIRKSEEDSKKPGK